MAYYVSSGTLNPTHSLTDHEVVNYRTYRHDVVISGIVDDICRLRSFVARQHSWRREGVCLPVSVQYSSLSTDDAANDDRQHCPGKLLLWQKSRDAYDIPQSAILGLFNCPYASFEGKNGRNFSVDCKLSWLSCSYKLLICCLFVCLDVNQGGTDHSHCTCNLAYTDILMNPDCTPKIRSVWPTIHVKIARQ